MSASRDVVVIGGGVMGAALACWLKAELGFPGSVTVVERDPTHARASTALSASGIRVQFTTPLNIALSRFGAEVIRDFPRRMATPAGPGPDLGFREQGYLFLAATPAQEAALRAAHAVQTDEGAQVALLAPEALAARFPHLETADLRAAALGLADEGWFDNMGLLAGLRARARAAGAEFLADAAVAIDRDGARVTAVHLHEGGRVACGMAVNAAGPNAGRVAAMAGLALPVAPRKRTVFVFDVERPPEGRLPLMIDPSGVFCRPEGRGFLGGAPPVEDPEVDPDDFDPRHEEFEDVVWPTLAARAPCFEAIRLRRYWAGHYDWNALDQNAVIGPHPEVGNFLMLTGFSGHGLQHACGAGRGLAEWIAFGAWRSLDLSALGMARVLEGRPYPEAAVI